MDATHGAAGAAARPEPALRGLRCAAELAKDRPHGDRLRYLAGCRCSECRGANCAYEKARAAARKAGDWNGLVPAAEARAHLAALSAQGVGYKTAADAAGVAASIVAKIVAGTRSRIRARSERAILGVTAQAAADRALVDAGATWQLLDELIADGYRKTYLARELGSRSKTPALQLQRTQVTARSAFDVQQLHARLRYCDARDTLELLHDLSDEGFHRSRVAKELERLAAQLAVDAPDLAVRNGRMRHGTAVLVARLHAQLTGE